MPPLKLTHDLIVLFDMGIQTAVHVVLLFHQHVWVFISSSFNSRCLDIILAVPDTSGFCLKCSSIISISAYGAIFFNTFAAMIKKLIPPVILGDHNNLVDLLISFKYLIIFNEYVEIPATGGGFSGGHPGSINIFSENVSTIIDKHHNRNNLLICGIYRYRANNRPERHFMLISRQEKNKTRKEVR